MKLRNQTTLSVSTVTDVVMLIAPHKPSDQDPSLSSDVACSSSEKTLLHGTITLALTKTRVVKEILVELVARQSIVIDGFRHTYGIRETWAHLSTHAQTLHPGNYYFPFELVVPSNAAPTERTPYGRTQHNVIASIKGAGHLGRTITALRPVTLIAQHSAGLPLPFNLDTEAFSANLGPILAELSSPYLVVAGSVNLSLHVPAILQHLRIDDVRVEIVQNYEVRALNEASSSKTVARDIIPVWSVLEEAEATTCIPGGAFRIEKHLQLPTERDLRPSTPKASITGVKVSHKCMVIVTYSLLGASASRQKKEFCIGMPATISSCRSLVDGNQLPAYAEREVLTKAPDYTAPNCLCKMSGKARETYLSRYADDWTINSTTQTPDVLAFRKRSGSESSQASRSTAELVL